MDNYSEEIEVCFITTTQYDFLVSDIYSRYLFDTFGIRSIVIYRKFANFDISKFDTNQKYRIIPYSINNKSTIGKCLFALQCGYLFPFSRFQRLLDRHKRIILFAFTDTSKLTYRMIELVKKINSENRVFLIDEGTDTYSDVLALKNEKIWHLKHALSKILFGCGRVSKIIGDNPLIDGAIVRYPSIYKKLKKAKNQCVIQQNTDLLSFADDFTSHYSSTEINSFICDVLYLGQPYYKNGKYYIPEEECITQILSRLPDGTRVLIKPHPRDNRNKYNSIVNNFKNVSLVGNELSAFPIETLLKFTRAKVVICIQSTAAITLADMFPEIGSIVLRRVPEAVRLFARLQETGEELPDFDDELIKSANKNIYIPNNLNDFEILVKELLNKGLIDYTPKANRKATFAEMNQLIEEASKILKTAEM